MAGMLDLDDLESKGNAATAGPWRLTDSGTIPVGMQWLLHIDNDQERADAEWCVAARNNWQAMIDELRQLRAELDLRLKASDLNQDNLALRENIAALSAENERLRMDSARLDWLDAHRLRTERHGGSKDGEEGYAWAVAAAGDRSLREVLDIVMAK